VGRRLGEGEKLKEMEGWGVDACIVSVWWVEDGSKWYRGSGKLQLRLDVQVRHLDERMTWSWIDLGIGVMAFSELGLTILFLSCFVVHSFVSWRSRLLREGWKEEA